MTDEGSGMPPAVYDTIENINWQIQMERPDNADSMALKWGALTWRVNHVRDRLLDTYRDLGDWTSPSAKVSFFTRVVTARVDLGNVAERAGEIRSGLYELGRVMRTGQTDMQELYDEFVETMAAWDEARAEDLEAASKDYTGMTSLAQRRTHDIEVNSRVGAANNSLTADRQAFKALWDTEAQSERDRISSTYNEAIGKLLASVPTIDVLDSRAHPKAFDPNFTMPPGGGPGAGPGSPGSPPPTGPAPGTATGAAPGAPTGAAPVGPAGVTSVPAATGAAPPPAGAPGDVGDVPGTGPATEAPPAPAGPAGGGAGGGAGDAPRMPAGPGFVPPNMGGGGGAPNGQGGRPPGTPTVLNSQPSPDSPVFGKPRAAPDVPGGIGPQPPSSVITSPGSTDPTAMPGMSPPSTGGPPDGGVSSPGMGAPPGMGMPPGMGGPPGAPQRQQPQQAGDNPDQPGATPPATPRLPGMPGAGGAPATGAPPGAGAPPGNQRPQAAAPSGGADLSPQQAFLPPMTGAPPVLGAPQRRGQRRPGGSAEAPAAARGGAPASGGTAPILSNQRFTGARQTYTEQREATRAARRERAKRFAEILKSQFAESLPTSTSPVLEGGAPAEATTARGAEVPAALQGRRPAPAVRDRHLRPELPADRTTRRILPDQSSAPPEQSATSGQAAWEVETPGGPVVAGDKPKRQVAPPPALGNKG